MFRAFLRKRARGHAQHTICDTADARSIALLRCKHEHRTSRRASTKREHSRGHFTLHCRSTSSSTRHLPRRDDGSDCTLHRPRNTFLHHADRPSRHDQMCAVHRLEHRSLQLHESTTSDMDAMCRQLSNATLWISLKRHSETHAGISGLYARIIHQHNQRRNS